MSKKKKTRNLSKEINKKILKIWHDHSKFITKNFGNYAPLLYPKLQRRPDILFVGLNPSLNEEWLKKQYFGEEILQKIKIRWKERLSSKDLVDLVKIEEIARRGVAKEGIKPYPYYKKFDKVCEKIGSWESIDLFLVRKTKQIQFKRNIEKFLLCEKQFLSKEREFFLEQIKLAVEVIENITPRIIVVVNAFASDILKDKKIMKGCGFEIIDENFEERGYDVFKTKTLKIPILFSSMLSGQRALDKHSCRRLKWHIKKILEETRKRRSEIGKR